MLDERAYIEKQRAEEDQVERKNRLGWAVSWTGMFSSPLGGVYLFYVFAVSTMLMVGLAAVFSIALPRWLMPGGTKVVPVPTTIGIFFFWLYTRGAPKRAVARERAWIRSLPFALHGYEEALGDSPSQNEKFIELRFKFEKDPPDDQLIDLLSGDGGPWLINPRNGHPKRDSGPVSHNADHNGALRIWFHQLVERQLMPLYRAHPFTELQLINRD